MTTEMGPFARLPDDTLAHIVINLDFKSVETFTKDVCTPLTERFQTDSFQHVWRQIYLRHHFVPPVGSKHYMEECKKRRQLVQNLIGPRQCLALPNRYFYFQPVLPNDVHHDHDDDPPPVNFDCNSFILTCPGLGSEFLFLDPFDMSLSIYANCTENAVASDERMMTNAMTNAASALLESHNEREEDIAGAVIDETVYRNHHVEQFQTPPCQVLIDAQAYFDVNLAEYFGFTRNGHARRRTPQGGLLLHPDDEVDFGYIGIEAKPIVGKSGKLEGTMIGLGRFLCSLQVDASQDEHIACTEIVTWRKMNGQSQYGDVRICRVPWDIYCADTCSKNNLMYVVFYRAQGPLPRAPGDDATDESDSLGRKTVIAFPLMPATDTATPTCPRYFPDEQFRFTCSDFVSYVTVDCNGTLIVGTNNGFVEIWKPDTVKGPTRVALINMKEATTTSVKRLEHAQKEQLVPNQDHDAIMSHKSSSLAPTPSLQTDTDLPLVIGDSVPIMVEGEDDDIESVATRLANANDDRNELDNELDVAMEDQAPVVVANDNEIENLPRVLGTSEVDSLHFPNHLGVEECGFITQQNSRADGTTLLLWKKAGGDLDNEFQVVSQINLPLSPLRKPRVHYDGRRIVVCGQDHIGVIILVYHVFSSTEDVEYFPLNFDTKLGDESGGLYNFTMNPHVRFANRIRHAALGGLERFEAMFMTCNERFIMVNTKTGNLLGGGASPSGEGLLVIDLKEHE